MNKIFLILKNTYLYIGLLIIEIVFFSWLNFDNNTMDGILPLYQYYTDFFHAKIDSSFIFTEANITYPMWGYSLLLLLTSSKLVIVIIQQLFSIYTIFFVERTLKFSGWSIDKIKIYRLLILLGICWHIYHTTIWAYSIATNCMIISLLLLYRFLHTKKIKTIIVSALLFGVTLNFRSDYFYFILCFTLILLIYDFLLKRKLYLYILLWCGLILASVIPWGIYTYKQSNHVSFTSTNGGHVLFIGLGQLPNNIWGITPYDDDLRMHNVLKEKQGFDYQGSITYEANSILFKEWRNYVTENPLEFFKKCLYVQTLYLSEPFTHGQLYRRFISKEKWDNQKYEIKNAVLNLELKKVIHHFFNKSALYLWIILIVSLLAIGIQLLFWFQLSKHLLKHFKTLIKNDLFVILICLIGYQVLLQTVAYYISYYNTNAFIFYIILITMFLGDSKKKVTV